MLLRFCADHLVLDREANRCVPNAFAAIFTENKQTFPVETEKEPDRDRENLLEQFQAQLAVAACTVLLLLNSVLFVVRCKESKDRSYRGWNARGRRRDSYYD